MASKEIDYNRLEKSPYLLDLLIQMEDVLDSLDMYVFRNWFDGEIVEGPKVGRYWLEMTLAYAYDEMPDPRAIRRLIKNNIRVDYRAVGPGDDGDDERQSDKEEAGVEDSQDATGSQTTATRDEQQWLVTLSIPRRLITELNAAELDNYEDEVDADDVRDAADDGVTNDTAYVNQDGGTVDAQQG